MGNNKKSNRVVITYFQDAAKLNIDLRHKICQIAMLMKNHFIIYILSQFRFYFPHYFTISWSPMVDSFQTVFKVGASQIEVRFKRDHIVHITINIPSTYSTSACLGLKPTEHDQTTIDNPRSESNCCLSSSPPEACKLQNSDSNLSSSWWMGRDINKMLILKVSQFLQLRLENGKPESF